MQTRHGIGEFEDDGALDERDELIAWLVQRIENVVRLGGFCGVDVFGVRADAAMLATIIGAHGGGHLIQRTKVEEWTRRIDQPFTDDSMRGFIGWSEEAWSEWRIGCKKTMRKLRDVLEG